MDADSSRAANEAEEVRKNVTASTLINKRKPEDQEQQAKKKQELRFESKYANNFKRLLDKEERLNFYHL